MQIIPEETNCARLECKLKLGNETYMKSALSQTLPQIFSTVLAITMVAFAPTFAHAADEAPAVKATDALTAQVPKLNLLSSTGENVKTPEAFSGKWTLLYFYPKDGSPGCTVQAQKYRDSLSDFKKNGIQIFGVSEDDIASHKSFIEKNQINFPLLVDKDYQLAKALGAYNGTRLSRDTFFIGPDGKVIKAWRHVDPSTTVADTYQEALRLKTTK